MDPIFGLAIALPPRGSRERLRALHRQLRAAILDGRLKPGLRLPPTRGLAAVLAVSRNTAVACYDLLLGEGYLVARPGAGTFVADALPQSKRAHAPRAPLADRRLGAARLPTVPAPMQGIASRFDFRVGLPDTAFLPFHVWHRLSTRALRATSRASAAYAEPDGQPALREAIARHVSFARAVACGAGDVVVTAGAQQAFGLIARVVVGAERSIAVEEPGYPPLRAAFEAAGARIAPVPVDDEGLQVDKLPADAGVVCVTPSHQFPLGAVMSARRRKALLDFAQANRAVLIEDDYDGEFRFGGRPLEALQTLDRAESVFYVGTFSKSLFPALRLGFVAAPSWARAALVRAKLIADWHCPVLAQDTLAAFIAEGHLARHIRKMRAIYRDRRTALLQALARHSGDLLQPMPGEAGLHLAVRLAAPLKANALIARAKHEGLSVVSLDRYATRPNAPNGFVLGYGMIDAEQIDAAIHKFVQVIRNGL